jgi:hypothetical protein
MKEENKIQKSFDLTITDSNLEDLAIDFSELTIDSLLDESLFKDIPIVSTIVSLSKFGANVRDKLFLRKIFSFLSGLKGVPAINRSKMIKKIDESKQYRVKVGEKLLYIIDSCSDFENSERIAYLFKAFIEGVIDYNDFLRTSNVLEKITDYDFKWFIKNAKEHTNVENVGGLISSGLFDLSYNPIDVQVNEESDRKTLLEGGSKYKTDVDGGDMIVTFSHAGEIVMKLFNPEYNQRRPLSISDIVSQEVNKKYR